MPHTARVRIPESCILRTDNPDAEITSNILGLPEGMAHRIHDEGALRALKRCHHQTAAQAYADIPHHREVYFGDELNMRVFVDRYGSVGAQTVPEYAIRRPGTIQSLRPANGNPRHMAAPPCHLTDEWISETVLAAIQQGVPFSWSAVRPKFWKQVGDFLIFWPSHLGIYGAAAIDKLGESIPLEEFTADNPFDPQVIHVGLPWLSKQEFDGQYRILCGAGRRRLVIVNCGLYDGGVKKPINFQWNDRRLARESSFIVTHHAMTRGRNGKVFSIGTTTAAGKTEGSSDEAELDTGGVLEWLLGEDVRGSIDVSLKSPLTRARGERRVGSDDITAIGCTLEGRAEGVEIEPSHFNRVDLCTGPGTLKIAEAAAEGKLEGRVYFLNLGFDHEKQEFVPWEHTMLGTDERCTNPRISYQVNANPRMELTTPTERMPIDCFILAIPVPEIPHGWHMPTFLRLTKEQFLVQNCHGARANKGNPALGAIGSGHWAFEGFGGKRGFTLDSEAQMFDRDFHFWNGLDPETPFFLVFNGFSMGAKQRFKYSGTYLLRFLLENYWEQLLRAPLLEVPGAYTGGVPDLCSFLEPGAIPRELWDPRALDAKALRRDALELDLFCYNGLNNISGQTGLSTNSRRRLERLMRESNMALRL